MVLAMKNHLQLKLAQAARKAENRRILSRQRAYTERTTREYREVCAAAILGIGAESPRYQETMKRREASRH